MSFDGTISVLNICDKLAVERGELNSETTAGLVEILVNTCT